ncbi:MAG: GldG family protein [Hyphomicrobium sp.]
MSSPIDYSFEGLKTWAVERASGLSRQTLAWGGLALAAVILLSLNLATSLTLKNWRADLTEDGLFTISDGTKVVLKTIDEPIIARLYFSKKLGEVNPPSRRYFNRVRTLLERYRDLAGGKLQLEISDPEPFSDSEERAVAAGLRGLRLNAEGDLGYFGLTAANATDKRASIGYFAEEREDFLEYDLTKLVHTLSNPKRRVVGVMTGLPIDGGTAPMTNQPLPVWSIFDQVREFFDVEKVDMGVRKIPDGLDVLIVAQPSKLSPIAAYAVDQYVLKGGKALVFIDPMAEAAQLTMMASGGEGTSELGRMLRAWGIDYDAKKVAADIRNARRVSFGAKPGQPPMVTEFVTWLALDKRSLDENDVLSSGIDELSFASAGSLGKTDGAPIEFQPIVQTSAESARLDASKTGMGGDPIALLRDYKSEGKRLTLAARVSGDAKSAFPNGNPDLVEIVESRAAMAADPGKDAAKKDDAKSVAPAVGDKKSDAAKSGTAKPDAAKPDAGKPDAAKPDEAKTENKPAEDPLKDHVATGKINLVVIADTDMLANQHWVQEREVLGQRTQVPVSDNASFLVGALENLSGSDALIALRGRGVKERPFTMVQDIRRESERKFREKEQGLTAKLKAVEGELEKLQVTGEGGATLLTEKERSAIDKFKGEMLATRRELREVKRGLREEIDSLDLWLQFANIALVPLGIAFGGLGWTLWQTRKRREEAQNSKPQASSGPTTGGPKSDGQTGGGSPAADGAAAKKRTTNA